MRKGGKGRWARVPAEQRNQECRADPDRRRDAWAWVGWWENALQKTKRHAKKCRRKLQYSAADPRARLKREEQVQYWNSRQ
mmetsp:Transcript_53431/g.107352  ORF Transcript_53431/g.107352 Transcript_53431/m.107352 type:complete len:81 (+) Transcript_53431:3-245(+)